MLTKNTITVQDTIIHIACLLALTTLVLAIIVIPY